MDWTLIIIIAIALYAFGVLGKGGRGGGRRGGAAKKPNASPVCAPTGANCQPGITKCCTGICYNGKCATSSQPTSDTSSRPKGCFSKDMMVTRGDGTNISIADVKTGDALRTVDSSLRPITDPVAVVSHEGEFVDTVTDFVEIHTADGGVLKLTPNHYVYTLRGMLTADSVMKGDEMVRNGSITRVSRIATARDAGMFNIVMKSTPYLIVNDYVASPVCDTIGAMPSRVPSVIHNAIPSLVRYCCKA